MDNKFTSSYNDAVLARILELRQQDLGYKAIANIMAKEYPNIPISVLGWKSKVERYLTKLGLNRSDKTSKNCQDKISNVIVRKPCSNTTPSTEMLKPMTGPKSVERKSDGSYIYESIIEIFEDEEVTPDSIIKAHKLSPADWEVISYKNNYWSQQTKDGKTVVLYQSKLIVKPRSFDNIAESVVLEHFTKKAKEHIKPKPERINKDTNPRMLEVNICDLHLGKLAFDAVSGDTYNYKIAKERFFNLVNTEYRRAKENKVEKILFVWSNDFFNTDGINNSTTRGTIQQTALPWQNLFLEGVSMLVDAIELLSTVAPVKSFYIASNHSRQADFYALCYLQAWFRNDDNVQIINNQKSRYYERYGVVLLGFSHSYYEKENNLYHLMSNECPEEWSETTYREFHLAHYHSEKVKDVGGVIYRWLPTVCGTDDYHYDKGYVGSVKRSYSFLYDKCVGLIQMNCNII